MDLNEIKQILDLVREHDLAEFEIEHDGLRLKVRKDTNGAHAVTPSALMVAPVIAPAAAEGAPLAAAAPAAAKPNEEQPASKAPEVGPKPETIEPSARGRRARREIAADNVKDTAALQTDSEASQPLLERVGFSVEQEMEVLGVPTWLLVRRAS